MPFRQPRDDLAVAQTPRAGLMPERLRLAGGHIVCPSGAVPIFSGRAGGICGDAG